jgi:hypothetical protein
MGNDMNPQSSENKPISQSINQVVQDTAIQNDIEVSVS